MAKAVLVTLALIFAAMLPAQAGTTGSLSGYVLDQRGNAVAGARITVANGSQSSAGLTDPRGFFVFLDLAPGAYVVVAQKAHYDTARANVSIVADVNERIVLHEPITLIFIACIDCGAFGMLVQERDTADVYSFRAVWNRLAPGPNGEDLIRYASGVIVPLTAPARAMP